MWYFHSFLSIFSGSILVQSSSNPLHSSQMNKFASSIGWSKSLKEKYIIFASSACNLRVIFLSWRYWTWGMFGWRVIWPLKYSIRRATKLVAQLQIACAWQRSGWHASVAAKGLFGVFVLLLGHACSACSTISKLGSASQVTASR